MNSCRNVFFFFSLSMEGKRDLRCPFSGMVDWLTPVVPNLLSALTQFPMRWPTTVQLFHCYVITCKFATATVLICVPWWSWATPVESRPTVWEDLVETNVRCLSKEETRLPEAVLGAWKVNSVGPLPLLIGTSLPLEGKESVCSFRLLPQSSVISTVLDSLIFF